MKKLEIKNDEGEVFVSARHRIIANIPRIDFCFDQRGPNYSVALDKEHAIALRDALNEFINS